MDRRGLLSAAEQQQASDQPPPPTIPLQPDVPPTATPTPRPRTQYLNIGQYLILISLNSIGAFSSDCYIPNLANVTADLDTSDQMGSLTIQINWIMLGLATPVVGHLSDLYGRRLVIWATLVIYVIGTLGSGLAPTIEWMLVARCVQGIGESVSIITSSIIRDMIDDKQERMKVQAYFTTMRPLMLLGGPSIGGLIGTVLGWRDLMKGLAGWGVLAMLLQVFIPESNQRLISPEDYAASVRGNSLKPRAGDDNTCCASCPDLPCCPGLDTSKFRRLVTNVDYVGLTISAAIAMAAVRSMLSNISFVYTHYYQLSTAIGGVLISVPPVLGLLSSLIAARLAARTSPARLARYGMAAGIIPPVVMLISAGVPHCVDCLYSRPRWYMTTIPCGLLSAVGFFALPAMQVLVLQDFKDMSGLAGGLSKLVMTLVSTGASMLTSFYFSDWGKDDAQRHFYTHYHTQRLLYALAATLIVLQIQFWLIYVPLKRYYRRRSVLAIGASSGTAAGTGTGSTAGDNGASVFGAGDEPQLLLGGRQVTRSRSLLNWSAAGLSGRLSNASPVTPAPDAVTSETRGNTANPSASLG